ncbi:MAG: response regulator [Myxococcota bacterium]
MTDGVDARLQGSSILIVDDDEILRERLVRSFSRRGFEALEAGDYESALVVVRQHRIDLAVIDLRMPGESGLLVLRDLLDTHPEALVVILSGYGSIATAIDAVRLGAVDFVQKPADVDQLIEAFARALEDNPLVERDPTYDPPSLARAEWEHIQRVLHDCGGNITKAARMLGLHRRTLQRKLQKHPPRQ